jgi:hypothetical protein
VDWEKEHAVRREAFEKLKARMELGIASLDRLQRQEAELNRLSEQLDRTLITLSSGALVLSMTFLRGSTVLTTLWLLFTAWGFFIASIFCVIFSMTCAQVGLGRDLRSSSEFLNQSLQDAVEHTDTAQVPVDPYKTLFRILINGFNILALVSFLLGLAMLGIFVGYNVWLEHEGSSGCLL